MRSTWFKSGDWNAICDICGFKRKASQLIQRWDGFMVCEPSIKTGCWETRHPQDFVRPVSEQMKLLWTRPEPSDRNVPILACTLSGNQGIAGFGVSGCAIPNIDYGIRGLIDITHS